MPGESGNLSVTNIKNSKHGLQEFEMWNQLLLSVLINIEFDNLNFASVEDLALMINKLTLKAPRQT